jgi:uncharacterized protein YdhG (YjbR/CyaY superfamily)
MREWQPDAAEAIEGYIKGMRTLTENRNTLIHGNIVDMAMGTTQEPAIISLGRDGRTSLFKSSLPAIRQVADDRALDDEHVGPERDYLPRVRHHAVRVARAPAGDKL